jgi:prolyl-tRNA editing enzyme YbaK/EbsC (Cys-tRNA(Pro) deacylase)
MKDALAIHRSLLAHQIHHEIVRLPRALASSDDLPDVLGVDPRSCVGVTLFEVTTRAGRDPVAVVATVGSAPSLVTVGATVGATRVRPASPYMVNSVTDYAAGLVSPLLLPENLTVLVDQRVLDGFGPDDTVYTPTGERRTALQIRAFHLFTLVSGKPVDLTPPARPAMTR